MNKEYEALNWLKTECYVESPQDEMFDECCDVIVQALLKTEKLEKAIKCIEKRSIYSIELKEYVFVNKLIYWEDDLMIIGYSDKSQFKVEDYGITWKEVLV